MLRLAPALTLSIMIVPIGAGLVGTLLPAFGFFPPIGATGLGLGPWIDLLAQPGFSTSVMLSVSVGLCATLVSLALACGFCAVASTRPAFGRLTRLLPPLLATPHVAIAIGFAFLIAPSGLTVRLFSPWATGWERPPGIVTLRDPYGIGLVAGLVLKETAYLVLMIVAASGQARIRAMLGAARSLGYAPLQAWAKVVLPLVYPQIRLPIYAVIAFSLSNVEIALILGPGNPPPLAVVALRWFSSYDLQQYLPAAAAATLQFLIVLAGIAGWRLAEIVVSLVARAWAVRGTRRGLADVLLAGACWGALATGLLSLASVAVMLVWSFADTWRYPDALPAAWTLATWDRYLPEVLEVAGTTAGIALCSTLVALALVLACLENEQRRGLKVGSGALWLLYLPLLVPQIAFLFGAQVLLVRLALDATLFAVVWAHLLFVLPYVFLSLADPFRAIDPRYARIAAGLRASPLRSFLTIKVPMLLRPILVAGAVGFAVSVSLYLPTLFAGAGRITTLTSEAVTLATGADRRVIGIYAFLQAALPLLAYALALGLPAWLYRDRKAVP